MNKTDPIAEMLTRIRNANLAKKEYVDVSFSKIKVSIARILKDEGFIKYYKKVERTKKYGNIRIFLKFGPKGERVISNLNRVSTPGRRVYLGTNEIPRVMGGLGLAIISTSKGVMTDRECKKVGVGGELICTVW